MHPPFSFGLAGRDTKPVGWQPASKGWGEVGVFAYKASPFGADGYKMEVYPKCVYP